MYSKEEKLAAARKKLREFQDKQRESVINKTTVPQNANANVKDMTSQIPSQSPSSSTGESSHTSSYHEHIPEKDESKVEKLTNTSVKTSDSTYAGDPQKAISLLHSQDVSGNPTPTVISPEKSGPGGLNANTFGELPHKANENPIKYGNGLFSGDGITHAESNSFTTLETSDSDKIKIEMANFFKDKDTEIPMKEMQNNNSDGNSSLVQENITNPASNEPKDFFWTTFTSGKKSDETEPQNEDFSQLSIAQLIEENTNLTEVLKRTQELLKYKTGEEENLAQKLALIEGKVEDLQEVISHADNEIHKLKVRNEKLLSQQLVNGSATDEIRQMYDEKVEEFSELQQKFELKTIECDHLNAKLHETQCRLSASLIKIQQLKVGESKVLNMRVSELQNENASLGNKIQDLEKSLDTANKEKEESNQSFQTYAQQCNAQLQSLSSEVRRLTKENKLQTEKNKMLEKNINDLEIEKNELKAAANLSELKSLIDDITKLKEEKKKLEQRLTEKVIEVDTLKYDIKEKINENNYITNILEEIKGENLKLLEERDRTNRNEKLLAAMESDKVAAARAVAQNQKLKEQILELEEGFIKLSHEKLQLTDELAHERHLKKEMEARLQELQSSHCHDHDHNKSEYTVTNESSDVNELKKIIRQLEEDKTELISRLKSCNYTKGVDKSTDVETDELYWESISDNSDDPENLKVLLQQMEEKLKKTMNEIALLDEEKEKLEHIVTQLQSETETIGEYISLYQNQRMILRKRSKEKDEQLMQLTKDKEEMRSKLIIMNDLVKHLLAERGIGIKKEPVVPKTLDSTEQAQSAEGAEGAEAAKASETPDGTAEKIQNLISEIEAANLINSGSVSFEHCPCCSGRLLTV